MSEEFKKSPLACVLLGILIGIGSTLGFQSITTTTAQPVSPKAIVGLIDSDNEEVTDGSSGNTTTSSFPKPNDRFKDIPENQNGDVMVTKSGKYHRLHCSSLRQAINPKRVMKQDAIDYGFDACKRCKP